MKLTMLGTGNALVTECYNTCFVLSDEYGHFLVDGGGGNTVLSQLKKAGVDLMDVHEIFVTHKHVDHIMGIVWVIRIICQNMKKGTYQGEANIYAHDEVIGLLKDMAFKLLNKKETQYIGDRLHLIEVKDGEEKTILNKKVTFFDIGSTKAKQFGFQMIYDVCGDHGTVVAAEFQLRQVDLGPQLLGTVVHQLAQAAVCGHTARQTHLLCTGVGGSQQQFFGQDARIP